MTTLPTNKVKDKMKLTEEELDALEDLADLEELAVLEEDLPKEPPSEFAIQLRPSLEKILAALVQGELIEFEEDKKELLFDEMIEAAEKARHPKAILKAVMYALIKSDNVEEIYGSDPELMKIIKAAVSS